MRGGIVAGRDRVCAFTHNSPIPDDDCREGTAGSGGDILSCEFDRAAQEIRIRCTGSQLALNLPERRKY